jgi:hypothetical protein
MKRVSHRQQESEYSIAKTLALILNHAGFDAHAFLDGQDAVGSLEQAPARFADHRRGYAWYERR